MTMKNHQYSQFFWHMSVSGVFVVHVTVPTLTPLNLLLKSARTAHPVLNAFSTVFILTSTVISIHSSIWLEGGWWMTCATFGDTLPQKGQGYDKELGTMTHVVSIMWHPVRMLEYTPYTIIHSSVCITTVAAVHCMRSDLIRRSTHRKTYSLKLPTQCRFVWKWLPTNLDFVSVVPTESHFVWVLPTESCGRFWIQDYPQQVWNVTELPAERCICCNVTHKNRFSS